MDYNFIQQFFFQNGEKKKGLIKKLDKSTGVSSFEDEIRKLIKQEIKSFSDEMYVDTLGNLIAKKERKQINSKRIMIAGQINEIGVMDIKINIEDCLKVILMQEPLT